jgi:hypothetical protein
MDNFNNISEEITELVENYIQNENNIYFQTMEESWTNLIKKGKLFFNDLSYLSAFDIKFLKFKLHQYQLSYLKIMESNDIELTKIISNFIIMLSIGIDQLQVDKFK